MQHDVDTARGIANFSEYAGLPSAEEFAHAVTDNMPPLQYTLIHPSAKLTDAEKQTLVDGYQSSFAANNGGTSGGGQSSTPAHRGAPPTGRRSSSRAAAPATALPPRTMPAARRRRRR